MAVLFNFISIQSNILYIIKIKHVIILFLSTTCDSDNSFILNRGIHSTWGVWSKIAHWCFNDIVIVLNWDLRRVSIKHKGRALSFLHKKKISWRRNWTRSNFAKEEALRLGRRVLSEGSRSFEEIRWFYIILLLIRIWNRNWRLLWIVYRGLRLNFVLISRRSGKV